ncbi:hypothetical protein, partial [Streptomyces calidiresistens]
MIDPLLNVVLDRWRHISGRPAATADDPFTAADQDAYVADLRDLLGPEVSAADIARCGTPRALSEWLRARRRGARGPAPVPGHGP